MRRWCRLYGHKWGGWRRDRENERVVGTGPETRVTTPQTRRCRRCQFIETREES